MKLPQDFREFLELFNAKGVEYMIVGSYALAYYGAPRYTGDIDLFVRRTEVNAQRIICALNEFGFTSPNSVLPLPISPGMISSRTTPSFN